MSEGDVISGRVSYFVKGYDNKAYEGDSSNLNIFVLGQETRSVCQKIEVDLIRVSSILEFFENKAKTDKEYVVRFFCDYKDSIESSLKNVREYHKTLLDYTNENSDLEFLLSIEGDAIEKILNSHVRYDKFKKANPQSL